jgi:hypothetical protein
MLILLESRILTFSSNMEDKLSKLLLQRTLESMLYGKKNLTFKILLEE